MPLFVTIGYGDRAGYESTPQAVLDAAHANDESLARDGAVMGMAGQPALVRNHNGGGTEVEDGPYLSAALPVAGFALIEADSIEEAVRLMEKSPCAVAQGVIEIWPLVQPPSQ
jgi:hypothetical protein